ncbi:hypothetical protein PHLCEN_2v4010 [Hermanssonia centrifuga]|uniref:CCHC-type domain-containing protein n=1 Tax=Hermanssonia centrifuga TaxID=98765 RepID=A0A2R6Q7H8_9APHY|nr:hypothetical protein PHLCEN_2v4010 [Hermanssonia centrifuga]
MFHENLKLDVKDLLITITPSKIFDVCINRVVMVDNWLHKRELEKKHAKSCSSNFSHSSSRIPSHLAPVASSSSADPTPMEVDAVCRGPLTAAEKDYRRKHGLCFYCRKGKHLVTDCPNMLETAKKNNGKGKANPLGKA